MQNNVKLAKLDLSKNLIPLKYINDISKKCEQNNDKTDDKLMPRLMREYNRQIANQRQPEDFKKVHNELEHYKRLEKTEQNRCSGLKDDFWDVYNQYNKIKKDLEEKKEETI